MSVPVSRRKPCALDVLVKAQNLCEYTVKITANAKKFNPAYFVLTERIADASISIGADLFYANNIDVNTLEDYTERKALQDHAEYSCNELLFLIDVANRLNKQTEGRIEYWTSNVYDVIQGIRQWRESDGQAFAYLL